VAVIISSLTLMAVLLRSSP